MTEPQTFYWKNPTGEKVEIYNSPPLPPCPEGYVCTIRKDATIAFAPSVPCKVNYGAEVALTLVALLCGFAVARFYEARRARG